MSTIKMQLYAVLVNEDKRFPHKINDAPQKQLCIVTKILLHNTRNQLDDRANPPPFQFIFLLSFYNTLCYNYFSPRNIINENGFM